MDSLKYKYLIYLKKVNLVVEDVASSTCISCKKSSARPSYGASPNTLSGYPGLTFGPLESRFFRSIRHDPILFFRCRSNLIVFDISQMLYLLDMSCDR